jgi:CheY-like chemotaxis protein
LLNVLLAEDHPTGQKVVEAILRAFGCEIKTVNNGQEAVDACRGGAFDLVLMDMAMPVMDGLEAIRLIRMRETQTKTRRTPISMISANSAAIDKRHSHEAGADFHIAKPVTPHSLLDGLEKTIHAAKANAQAA